MVIDRIVSPQRPTPDVSPESADIRDAPVAGMAPARIVAHALVMVALAAFAILVVLPVAIAAQVTVPM